MAATFGQFPANFRFSGALINNLPSVLEMIICYFSFCLKTMSKNIFPEPQPDSAS